MARNYAPLGKPRGVGRELAYDRDAFARWAEAIAHFLGTGRYLAVQTVVFVTWIGLNVAVAGLWDSYPFRLLNLVLSTQAAYAAPLILLAQNRQADRDQEEVERSRAANARSLAGAEYLSRELRALRMTLDQKADRDEIYNSLREMVMVVERLETRPRLDPGSESSSDG
jgi:uncharacterized membrane protein